MLQPQSWVNPGPDPAPSFMHRAAVFAGVVQGGQQDGSSMLGHGKGDVMCDGAEPQGLRGLCSTAAEGAEVGSASLRLHPKRLSGLHFRKASPCFPILICLQNIFSQHTDTFFHYYYFWQCFPGLFWVQCNGSHSLMQRGVFSLWIKPLWEKILK